MAAAPSAIGPLPSRHPPSAIRHLPSAICHLPSAIRQRRSQYATLRAHTKNARRYPMDPVQVLDARIASKHLLNHTFYQRWTCGTLTREELRDYAAQYFHYAMAFPTFISAMHAHTDDIATRQLLLENLIEEERGSEHHPELWLRFCESLGLTRAEVQQGNANDATRHLIATMKSLAREGALHEGLAALYE